MPHRTTEDLTRLPKWAQRKIEVLEKDLEYANAKLAVMGRHDGEGSNTFADPYYDYGNPDWEGIPLGKDQLVEFRFDLPDGEVHRPFTVHCRLEKERSGAQCLRLAGSDSFVVRPHSSNVVEILERVR